MRCECCDRPLNDSEATAKFVESGTYVNMCKSCRNTLPSDIAIRLRPDLKAEEPGEPWEYGGSEDGDDIYVFGQWDE